jgi:hypothetical protein
MIQAAIKPLEHILVGKAAQAFAWFDKANSLRLIWEIDVELNCTIAILVHS